MDLSRRMGAMGLLLALAACGGPPAPSSSMGDFIENTTWHLQSIDALRFEGDSNEGPWLRVNPADGRVEGFAGCNTFQGPYRAGGTNVAFGPLATTRRACPDDRGGELERLMLDLIQQADGYRVGEGRMELMVGGRIRGLFVAGPVR
jgi:heat shock protein HslJ